MLTSADTADCRTWITTHEGRQGIVVHMRRATMPDFVRYYNVTIMNPKVLVGMFMPA